MFLFLLILFIWFCLALTKHTKEIGAFSIEQTLPLRGLLALGIVLHHISQRVIQVAPDILGISQFVFIGPPIVAVFFFLSGYGLMKSLQIKGISYLNGFLKKRMLKVALPFVLCSLVYSVVSINILGGHFVNLKVDWPFLPNAWFCVTIIIYYFAFYFIAICSKSKFRQLAIWMWLFTLLYIVCLKFLNFENWWFQSVISINMGMTIALVEYPLRKLLVRYYGLLASVLFLFLCLSSFCVSFGYYCSFPCGWLGLSFLIGFFTYVLLCRYSLPVKRAISFLGKYSYEIYLIQGAIINVVFGKAYTYVYNWWIPMMILALFSIFFFAFILKKVMSIILV